MLNNDNFLDSASSIIENQAEYTILSDFPSKCKNMIFLFELLELKEIKFKYDKIIEFIAQNYKSFELRNFKLESDGSLSFEVLRSESGRSLKNEELLNLALDISVKNGSYILVQTTLTLALICKGKIETNFKNILLNKQALIYMNKNKRDINELELVFENNICDVTYSLISTSSP